MTTYQSITPSVTPPRPQTLPNLLRALAHKRLDHVLKRAKPVLFDDTSSLVFFSDAHRGDKSATDVFAKNESLFLSALSHYFQKGFTYVEVGDGDEMWKNRRFRKVLQANRPIYNLLHRFHQQDRLHLLFGNHDLVGLLHRVVNKDGMQAEEGLLLKHRSSGQRIFVTHGHQADLKSDSLRFLSRLVVRHIWRRVQLLGLFRERHTLGKGRLRKGIERRLVEWAQSREQITICGHTHIPAAAEYGAAPYFNCGCCVNSGALTGIEVRRGDIMLVQWSMHPITHAVTRELLASPRRLHAFGSY